MKRHTDCRQRRLGFLLIFSVIVIQWIIPIDSLAQSSNLTIGNYVKVSERRISRTVYEYTYRASITNNGPNIVNVRATVVSNSPNTSIVDNNLTFGDTFAGRTVTSTDTFTIRHDRLYPFYWSNLSWNIQWDEVKLEVTLDEVDSISIEVPLEGGKMEATSADGTDYTLEIPSNAFLEQAPTTITMTPILSVIGFSSGQEYLAGIRLKPDGLLLLKPAILKIVMPAALPTEDIFCIYVNGPEGEYYANPLISVDKSNSAITFEIMHFSDWLAVTSTLCPGITNPNSTEDYINTIACLANNDMWEEILPVLIAWFDALILPSLQASNDIESLKPTLLKSLEWRVYTQAFGFDGDPRIQSRVSRIAIEVKRVLTTEFQRLSDQCNATNDMCEKQNIYKTYLEWKVVAQALGSEYGIDIGEVLVGEFCSGIESWLVAEVTVSGVENVIHISDQIILTATLRSPNLTVITGQNVEWSSSNQLVATVANGVVTGIGLGDAVITATAGCNKKGYIDVHVGPEVSSLQVYTSAEIPILGSPVNFHVKAFNAEGAETQISGSTITWSQSPAVGSLNPLNGLSTTLVPNQVGPVTVTASYRNGQKTASKTVCVRAPIATIEVSPPSKTLFVGDTVHLTATAKTASGSTDFGCEFSPDFTWYSSNLNVATVDGIGNVRGVSKGVANISAVYGSKFGYSQITVFDMTGTWRYGETWQSSTCPVNTYEAGICTINQTGNLLSASYGPAYYTGSFISGRTFSWTLNAPYWLNQYTEVLSSSMTGTLSEDGLHYVTGDSWMVYYLDENGIWQQCSGYSTAVVDRL